MPTLNKHRIAEDRRTDGTVKVRRDVIFVDIFDTLFFLLLLRCGFSFLLRSMPSHFINTLFNFINNRLMEPVGPEIPQLEDINEEPIVVTNYSDL